MKNATPKINFPVKKQPNVNPTRIATIANMIRPRKILNICFKKSFMVSLQSFSLILQIALCHK